MIILGNLDLLSVGVVVAATTILGFGVYLSDPKSISNRMFLAFSLVTAAWGIVNYLNYQTQNYVQALWMIRLVMFFATWQAYTLFLLIYVFQKERIDHYFLKRPLLSIIALTSLLTLTPFVFPSIILAPSGQVSQPVANWGIFIFIVVAVSLVISSIVLLIHRIVTSSHDDRRRLILILAGVALTFVLIIVFNLVAVTVFNTTRFVPLGALFFFPFIAFTSYAILRHKLFNIRAVWAGILVFLLAITAFLEVIFANEISLIIYRTGIFFLVLAFGILLIRGIIHEIRQREEIEDLARRLKSVNSILAHDVKGAFTKGRNTLSLIMDGSYGAISEESRPLLKNLLDEWQKMLETIINILAAGQEMKLILAPLDLAEAIREVARSVTGDLEAKHLTMNLDIPEGADYTIMADKIQLSTHVIKNLIENAIYYNIDGGSITVKLAKKDPSAFILTIADTGIGIKEEDRQNLFKEGGRGRDSIKYNVHSSGYGLATAKKTVEAHGGKIWFESEGIIGRGTTFFVELPIGKPNEGDTDQRTN